MRGFNDTLIVVYEKDDAVLVDFLMESGETYTGILSDNAEDETAEPKSIVLFNVYDTPTDPLTGNYIKKLLFFPNKASAFLKITETQTKPTKWTSEELSAAALDTLYCYDDGEHKRYYEVKVTSTTDEDGNTVYSREIKKNGTQDRFNCAKMEAMIKSYYQDESETDESGAEIYPPRENADKSCYYKNTFNNEIYRYCEYETTDGDLAYGWKVSVPPAVPNIEYATVHLSRVFGVGGGRVYASGYNDYANWSLDTAGEYNESNAWCSPSQSNTKASGDFTGITTFQNHVICFKRDFMHEIYNTKNPFRIQDIFAEGAIDNRSIQDVDGQLIFVSEDNVKVYTGSNPRIIGYNLGIDRFTQAVSGSDGRNYYLFCKISGNKRRIFVYDTLVDEWSEIEASEDILSFAQQGGGMFALSKSGIVYRIDTNDYRHSWSFETDLMTNETIDIKHLQKIQVFAEMEQNASLRIYALYDDEKFNPTSQLVFSGGHTGKNLIRIKPRNSASYGIKLHFEGFGFVRIYEAELLMQSGGELYG